MNNYRIILETLAGSHMYGTSLPSSDIDYRGIAIQEISDLINPFHHFEQSVEQKRLTEQFGMLISFLGWHTIIIPILLRYFLQMIIPLLILKMKAKFF